MQEISELYNQALEDYRQKRFDDAADKLRHVLAIDASFEDAYEALSVILYNQKKFDSAVTLIKKWVVLNQNSIMARTNLSRCYAAKGMIAEAEHEQAEARRLSWKADLKSKQSGQPKVNYDAQIARFKKIIELDPADVLGYFSLGTAYLDSGRKREAKDTFEKAVEVDPKHSSSYLGLGLALEGLGDKAKAKDVYRKGMMVADQAGDLMPLRKMESRLKVIEEAL